MSKGQLDTHRMVNGTAFKEAYALLNAAQKDAVDSIEGPVMVIAGPGTGKTQILTLRIANIIAQTDSQPENILALTFTESGAKAMRERLLTYIGTPAYRVVIQTFHGFAERLISAYPDSYPRVIGGRPASDIDKIEIIETILESGEVETLRPGGNPQYYVKPLIGTISDLKREYVTPDALADGITREEEELAGMEKYHEKGAHKGKVRGDYTKKEKSIEKNRALLYVYRCYEALLTERGLYDFDDMIIETVEALQENEDMLRDLQETYHYILADEHQDVNGAQNKILELLASYHKRPNIFVVGDEKQAIFRFQGASLENFLYFGDVFPDTKTISLTENYRSGQQILDGAHSLIAVDEGPLAGLRVPLASQTDETGTIEERTFSHQAVEDAWVVDEVRREIDSGTPPDEIAVIVRSNREVEDLSTLLRSVGIAANASAEGDILHHPITHTVEQLLQAVVGSDTKALFTLMHGSYWNIPQSDLVRILAAQSSSRNLYEVIGDDEFLADIAPDAKEAVIHMRSVLGQARKRAEYEPPHHVLAYLIEESGLKDQLMAADPFGSGRVLRRLYDEVEDLVRRESILGIDTICRVLEQRRQYGLPLRAPFIANNHAAVEVMTAHKAKGLEFEVVIAPHLTDSSWGGRQARTIFKIPVQQHLTEDTIDTTDDERRLLYVLMTRAKRRLMVSTSETNAEGKPLVPSRLLAEIDEELLTQKKTTDAETTFDPCTSVRANTHRSPFDPEPVATLFAERGFSATSLNNYLSSPWNYYFRNIVRIPEVQPTHMLFGTALHGVMEYVTRSYTKKGKVPSDSEIKRVLDRELGKLPLSNEDYARLHEKGFAALLSYVPHIAAGLPKRTEEERSIRVGLETGLESIPVVPLSGKLDRLDFDADGKLLRVVDYKTGKPKTRNHIEGKTQSSDGGYKRQLVFYALLLELYDDDRCQTREGVLSFVEPDGKGVIHEEVFSITDEEIAELKQTIIDAAQAIVSGTFLKTTCDANICEYCHLVEMMHGG